MRIGLDIDGVILDFERTMRSYAELYDLLVLGKKGVVDASNFDYLKRYDWTEEERRKFIDDYLVYATLNSTPLIPLVKEMLKIFEVEGYEYFFITARGLLREETKKAVCKVFVENDILIDKICWAVNDKVLKCQELGIDLMIDDNPKTCRMLRDNEIKTIYFRDKGNEKLEENEFLKEVSNVGEIVRYIVYLNGCKNSKEMYKKILHK